MDKIDLGAVAEYAFASELLARGITPNWPSTETKAYDMIADTPSGSLHKCQVKGTKGRGPKIRMNIRRRSDGGRGYSPDEVDLIAIRLFEYDLWYLIPTDKIMKDMVIRPADPSCKWHRFKAAWHLLK
jgi:hypothetical protein